MARANTDSAKSDFRLDLPLDNAESSCLSAVSVWICASNVSVTCIDLKKESRRWIVRATAPYALPTKLQ